MSTQNKVLMTNVLSIKAVLLEDTKDLDKTLAILAGAIIDTMQEADNDSLLIEVGPLALKIELVGDTDFAKQLRTLNGEDLNAAIEEAKLLGMPFKVVHK